MNRTKKTIPTIPSEPVEFSPRLQQKLPKKRRTVKHIVLPLLILVVVWSILSFISSCFAWKAVFLDSNQVYFGRFVYLPFTSTVKLHDVHYLKPGSVTTEAGALPDLVVLPVEDDAHGPTSKMTITKSHILYYQKLQPGTTLYTGLKQSLDR
jgi:hypothetical protein